MPLSRRNFISSSIVGVTGFGLGGNPRRTASQVASTKISGSILAPGFDGGRHPDATQSSGLSVVSEIDLATGSIIEQVLVAIPNMHFAVRSAVGCDLYLPLDGDTIGIRNSSSKTLRFLRAPSGYLFSGHALLSADAAKIGRAHV